MSGGQSVPVAPAQLRRTGRARRARGPRAPQRSGQAGMLCWPPPYSRVWVGAPLQADRGAQVCGKGSVCTRGHGFMAPFAEEVEFKGVLVCVSTCLSSPRTPQCLG